MKKAALVLLCAFILAVPFTIGLLEKFPVQRTEVAGEITVNQNIDMNYNEPGLEAKNYAETGKFEAEAELMHQQALTVKADRRISIGEKFGGALGALTYLLGPLGALLFIIGCPVALLLLGAAIFAKKTGGNKTIIQFE